MLSKEEARDIEQEGAQARERRDRFMAGFTPESNAKPAPDKTNPKDLVGITKPPLHLVPGALVLWVSKVFQFSAYLRRPPYGPYNWRKNAVRKSIYVDAIERHLLALKDGEWLDVHKPDCPSDCGTHTGLPHAAQIGANVAIILDAYELGNLIDDMQWEPGPAPAIIHRMTEKK